MKSTLKSLGLAAVLLTCGSVVANADYTYYQDNFNSYTAGTAINTGTASSPTGPGWGNASSAYLLSDNGINGAGDLYLQGSSIPGTLGSPDQTSNIRTYGGFNDITRVSNGQYMITTASLEVQSQAVNPSSFTAGATYFGLGNSETGSGSDGVWSYDGTAGSKAGQWTFNVGSPYTASGLNVASTFATGVGGDQWITSYNQIDDVNDTIEGFLVVGSTVYDTGLIALKASDFSGGQIMADGSTRGLIYRNDTRFGTFGMNVDNIDVYSTNTALDLLSVPEPSTLAMIGLSLLGLWGVTQRRRVTE